MTILPSVTSHINRMSFFTFTFYFHPHSLCITFFIFIRVLHFLHTSFRIPFLFTTKSHKMAGSHESNPNPQIATSSKKSKSRKSGHSKSGKSGQVHEQHEHSKKRGKKRVQFSEEPSSKRQRVEDDPLVYKDGPLEAVSGNLRMQSPTSPMECSSTWTKLKN